MAEFELDTDFSEFSKEKSSFFGIGDSSFKLDTNFGPPPEPTITGELGKGVATGWLGMNKAVGDILEYFPKTTGANEPLKSPGMTLYDKLHPEETQGLKPPTGLGEQVSNYWAEAMKKYEPAVGNMTDISSIKEFGQWAAWNVGQMGSQIATTMPFMAMDKAFKGINLGAGFFRALSESQAKNALDGTMVGGFTALKSLFSRDPEKAGQFGKFLGDWARLKPMDIPIGVMEAGQVLGGQLDAQKRGEIGELDPIRALAAIFVATKLEELGAENAINRMVLGVKSETKSILKKIATGALATGAGEGTEEFFQQYAEQLGINPKDVFTKKQFIDSVNAAGAGFIGGFFLGGGGSALSGNRKATDPTSQKIEEQMKAMPEEYTEITQPSTLMGAAMPPLGQMPGAGFGMGGFEGENPVAPVTPTAPVAPAPAGAQAELGMGGTPDWNAEAEKAGVQFAGIQEGKNPIPLFNDPVTKTTFTLEGNETVADALARKRAQYQSKEVVPNVPKQEVQTKAPVRTAADVRKEMIGYVNKREKLTEAEGKKLDTLAVEYANLNFDEAKPTTAAAVLPAAETKSALSPETVATAHKDLLSNKGVYVAIVRAATGVFTNRDTPVDLILQGKNKELPAQKFYDAFNKTREALRAQFGDTVTLYRSEGEQKSKLTKNYATTEEFAKQFGGNVTKVAVPVENVVAVNVTANGKYHEVIVADKTKFLPATKPVAAGTVSDEKGDEKLRSAVGNLVTFAGGELQANRRGVFDYKGLPESKDPKWLAANIDKLRTMATAEAEKMGLRLVPGQGTVDTVLLKQPPVVNAADKIIPPGVPRVPPVVAGQPEKPAGKGTEALKEAARKVREAKAQAEAKAKEEKVKAREEKTRLRKEAKAAAKGPKVVAQKPYMSKYAEGTPMRMALDLIAKHGIRTELGHTKDKFNRPKAVQVLAGHSFEDTKDLRDRLKELGVNIHGGLSQKGVYTLDKLADELNAENIGFQGDANSLLEMLMTGKTLQEGKLSEEQLNNEIDRLEADRIEKERIARAEAEAAINRLAAQDAEYAEVPEGAEGIFISEVEAAAQEEANRLGYEPMTEAEKEAAYNDLLEFYEERKENEPTGQVKKAEEPAEPAAGRGREGGRERNIRGANERGAERGARNVRPEGEAAKPGGVERSAGSPVRTPEKVTPPARRGIHFGETNTLVTKADAEAALQRIREKTGRIALNIDPTLLKDYVIYGTYYVEGGARKFLDYSAKMLADFGDSIRPYLKPVYAEIKRMTKGNINFYGMDTAKTVDSAMKDLDAQIAAFEKKKAERLITAREEFTTLETEEDIQKYVPEDLRKNLTKPQQQGVTKALKTLEANEGFLFADGTGVGKTREILAVMESWRRKGEFVVIIAPNEVLGKPFDNKNTITGSYANDSKAMGIKLDLIPKGGLTAYEKGKIYITTYNHLPDIMKQQWGIVAGDESQVVKALTVKPSQVAKDFRTLTRRSRVLFATATPADKVEHVTYLKKIGMLEGRTEEQALTALGMKQKILPPVPNRPYEIKVWEKDPNVSGHERRRRFNALFERMTQNGAMIKRELDLEGVEIGITTVPLPEEAFNVLRRIWNGNVAVYGNRLIGLRLAKVRQDLRRQQEPFKVPHAVELTKKELANGRQVIIFASRVNKSDATVVVGRDPAGEPVYETLATSEGTMKLLREELAKEGITDVVGLHGKIKGEPKVKGKKVNAADAMEQFQSGKARVLIATIESGGTGINLDDVLGNRPRTMILMTAPFSIISAVQAAGRVWRMNTQHDADNPTRIMWAFSNTETDRWNAGIIAGKMKMLNVIVSGQVRRLDVEEMEEIETGANLGDEYGEDFVDGIEPAELPAEDAENTKKFMDELENIAGGEEAVATLKEELATEEKEVKEQNEKLEKSAELGPKKEAEAAAETLKVGDLVRVGLNMEGRIVGVDGIDVRVRMAGQPEKSFQIVRASRVVKIPEKNVALMSDVALSAIPMRLDANTEQLVRLLGDQYASNLSQVSLKELVQNSFDTIKEALHKGLLKKGEGKIEIDVNSDDRTLKVKDNGMGMTQETLQKALFTIGGTKKDIPANLASGGLGLAKLAMIANGSRIRVVTYRDGMQYTVDATTKDIIAHNFSAVPEKVSKDKHGTEYTVWIPEQRVDAKTGETRRVSFLMRSETYKHEDGFLARPLIGDVDITLKHSAFPDEVVKVPRGARENLTGYNKFSATFDWGAADIYFGIERAPSPEHAILSSGLFQFGTQFQQDPFGFSDTIEYNIIVDIKPNVRTDEEAYPFTNNREAFRERIKEDIKSLSVYLAQINLGRTAENLRDSFKDIQTLPRIDDVGEEIAADLEAQYQEALKRARDKLTKELENAPPPKALPKSIGILPGGQGIVDNDTGNEIITKDNLKKSTFQADQPAPAMSDFMVPLDHDPKNPIFHNNLNVDLMEAHPQGGMLLAELGSLVVEMKEQMVKAGRWEYAPLKDLFFSGITLDKGYGGIHIRVPFKALGLNPFYYVGYRPETAFGVANTWYEVITHEIGHASTMEHGVSHNTDMAVVRTYFADIGKKAYFEKALLEIYFKYEAAYNDMRRVYERSSTTNTTKGLIEYEGQTFQGPPPYSEREMGRPLVGVAYSQEPLRGRGEQGGRGNLLGNPEGSAATRKLREGLAKVSNRRRENSATLKDIPLELRERILDDIRGTEQKPTGEFIYGKAQEVLAEFDQPGTQLNTEISGEEGDEAQRLAQEYKTSLQNFVTKYNPEPVTAANEQMLPGTERVAGGRDTSFELTPKGEIAPRAKMPEQGSLFAVRNKGAMPFTAADVQSMFPGQKVEQNANGIFVTLKSGQQVLIKGVENISPSEKALQIGYGQKTLEPNQVVAGALIDGTIYVTKHADAWTLKEESIHKLEELGIITKQDQVLITAQAKKEGKWNPKLSAAENRAKWLVDFLMAKQPERSMLRQIWDKLNAIIRGIVGMRTAEDVAKGIKTGKIYDRELRYEQKLRLQYDELVLANASDDAFSHIYRGSGEKAKNLPKKNESWKQRANRVISELEEKAKTIEPLTGLSFNKADTDQYSVQFKKQVTDFVQNYTGHPENMPESAITELENAMNKFPGMKNKTIRSVLSLPYQNSQKHVDWKRLWDIFINRVENRMKMVYDLIQTAGPYLTRKKLLKDAGYTTAQRKDFDYRIGRILTLGDENLRNIVQDLKKQANDPNTSKEEKLALQKQINTYEREKAYSFEELTRGIKDDDGKIIQVKSQKEYDIYRSVRKAEDNLLQNLISHLNGMLFRAYRNQKWYGLLVAAAGPLNERSTRTLMDKGLNRASLLYAQQIAVDLDSIWSRLENVTNRKDKIEAMPEAEKQAVAKEYEDLSNEIAKELRKLRDHISKLTGIKDNTELEELTRNLFAAYQQTKPQLKKIKSLRNQVNEWIGFFPRHREQGNYKVRVVKVTIDPVTGGLVQKELHSEMFNTKAEGYALYSKIVEKYGKNGKLGQNISVMYDPVVKTPEGAFQGVNDVNVQQIIDAALQNVNIKGEYFDDKGNKVDIINNLWDSVYEAIANQFQSRGAGKSLIHRKQAVGEKAIKGYLEENHDQILVEHITAMVGLMTKQAAAFDALSALKDLKDKSLFDELRTYVNGQLRNETGLDRASSMFRSFAFSWYLGGMIKSAAVNSTQPIIVGIPMLARYMRTNGLGGFMKANRLQLQASADIAKSPKDLKFLSDMEKFFIQASTVDGSMMAQHIQFIRGEAKNLSRFARQAMDWLAYPFAQVEIYNRKTSGLAMFRVAYDNYVKQGLSEWKSAENRGEAYEKAMEDAHTFINNVHYPIGKHNLPLLAQSGDVLGVGLKTAYTFRMFTHNFMLNQFNLLRSEGKTKEEAMNDLKTFAHTMAYMAIFGGLMGLPFLKDLFEWIEKHFGYSPTSLVRKTLHGIGGQTLETFGMSGLPAVLGANISGSLAIGVPFMGETPTDTIWGVYGGQATKIKRMGEAAVVGDWYRFATNMAPEFIRGPVTAAEESQVGKDIFGTPGFSSTVKGRPSYDSQGNLLSMGPGEALVKSMGFQPTGFAREKELEQSMKRMEAWAQEKKTKIAEEYRIARIQKDPDAMKDMMRSVKEINQDIRDRGIPIPLASVSSIIKTSRETKNLQKRREQAYKAREEG